MQRNYFFIHKDFVNSLPSPPNLKALLYHNTTLPQWKNIWINNYKGDTVSSSLAIAIQIKQNVIIVSDRSKSKTISGGTWIIADILGHALISGTNPNFGHVNQIHSHRAEIYGVLSVFIFIQKYSKYYMIPFQTKVEYCCDNLEVIHKINILANNPKSFNEQYKPPIMMQFYNKNSVYRPI